MANEQAQAETTAAEETQTQTATSQDTGSEAASTQSTETGTGDLNVALRQEREKRQELESRLADPNFIYERAKSLGMTDEQAMDAAQQTQAPAQQATSPTDSYGQYQYFREIEKSQEKYPQLTSDKDDQVAITALMKEHKLSPLAAADRYYAKFNKQVEDAKVEGAKQQQATISEKEQAQTVTSTTSTNSDAAEYEDILKRSRDFTNPKAAERAQLELIKWKEAHR